ncbi:MAG: HAD family hydrolase [Nocardioidaceae bacterium]|nr:HAD family hydrolase [Nocardioidaceae bacterium]
MTALLLDLDQTLVDLQSVTDYAAARRDAEAIAAALAPQQVPGTDWTRDTLATMALLVACAGDERWAEVSRAVEVHERAAIPGSVAMPGLAQAWAETADVPRAVVTLLTEDVTRRVLAHHGVPGADAVPVIGRDAGRRPKPAPDGLLAACARLGVTPADAVMIGDSTWDLEAARAAGCGFVGVPVTPGALPAGTPIAPDLREAIRIALS